MCAPKDEMRKVFQKGEWETLSHTEALTFLQASADDGLFSEEAAKRLEIYGENKLSDVSVNPWYLVLIRQFTSVLIWILIIAAVLSYFVGEVGDTVTIVAIILLNGILGFFQEWKAEKAIQALQQMLSPKCRVVRDGKSVEIRAEFLVPGDIVEISVGDSVPADLRIIYSRNLRADESSLTGEVSPVNKNIEPVAEKTPLSEKSCMAWMGTNITEGYGFGVVVATGMDTEFGHIAELTGSVKAEETPLQKKFAVLGRQLGIISISVSVLVGVVGWLTGKPAMEMFMTGVSLAVAVVPEGLPAVVTVTLALGIRAMVNKNALIRRLQATETLGSATVICTDKTGTLTQNEMTVQKIWTHGCLYELSGQGYDPKGAIHCEGTKVNLEEHSTLRNLLITGLNCGHSKLNETEQGWEKIGEPTEAALVVAGYKGWLNKEDNYFERLEEFPFSSERKRMSIIVKDGDKMSVMAKGAPEVIIDRCDFIDGQDGVREITQADREMVRSAYTEMAKEGLRTLALAGKDINDIADEDSVESGLVLYGVAGIIDPPRPEVMDAIKLTKTAGIETIMITGDSPITAKAIAERIGIPADITITGTELDEIDDDELAELVEKNVIFARTTPAHKLRIVSALESRGHVVSMTGDGVNDAPALKKADIGIAMGIRGTDVAKGASEMILLDDNYASILKAIEEGRRQYANIQKFVRYLLSSNAGEVVAIFFSILAGMPLILVPVQILWMNLVTDGVTALALGMEPVEKGTMFQKPRPVHEKIMDKDGIASVSLLGTYMGLMTIALFVIYHNFRGESMEYARTMAFTGLIIFEKVNVFNFRSLYTPMKNVGYTSNPWLIGAVLSMFILQLLAVYHPSMNAVLHTVPIGWADWLLIIAFALPLYIVSEIVKIKRFKQLS